MSNSIRTDGGVPAGATLLSTEAAIDVLTTGNYTRLPDDVNDQDAIAMVIWSVREGITMVCQLSDGTLRYALTDMGTMLSALAGVDPNATFSGFAVAGEG